MSFLFLIYFTHHNHPPLYFQLFLSQMKLNKKKNKSENTVHYQFVNSKHIKTCKIIPKYTNSKLRNDLSKKCIKVYKEKRKPSLTRCTRSSSPKYRFLPLNHPVHRGQGHNTLPSLSVDHCSQRSRVYQSTSQKDPSRLIRPSPFSIVTRNTFSPENIVATGLKRLPDTPSTIHLDEINDVVSCI